MEAAPEQSVVDKPGTERRRQEGDACRPLSESSRTRSPRSEVQDEFRPTSRDIQQQSGCGLDVGSHPRPDDESGRGESALCMVQLHSQNARILDEAGNNIDESVILTGRAGNAALKFPRRAMKRYGRPASIVTDRFPFYRVALPVIGNADAQTCGRWLNNRAENSHQPFRRREGALANFRDVKTLQEFAAVHASVHNHFNHDRHLNRRDIFKQNHSAAVAEWRQLAA